MPNIVISGCGNIGSRLLQSVSNIDDKKIGELDIYGIDPFQSSLDLSTERFLEENKGGHTLHMSTSPAALPEEADLLIVSVDAANRLTALNAVLEYCTPKAIILEKILFNKFEEFETVQKIIDDLGVPCWVNCSRNVWPGYQALKETLGGKNITSYTASGSDWGLGCNAIHFIAAMEFLTGDAVTELSMDKKTAKERESKRLKLRIIIAAHTGHGGHRSTNVTMATVRAHFSWKKLENDIKSFVNTCLHCLCTQPATTVTRPLGHALHADHPNELLHFDFCHMSPAEDDLLYVLILKDDHSGYVWLVPTTKTTAETIADSLIKLFAAF